MLILQIVIIAVVMTFLLFVMNSFAKNERIYWAYFVLGIEFMLLGMFLVSLFRLNIIFFVLVLFYFILMCTLGIRNYYNLKIVEIDLESEYVNEDISVGFVADFQFDKHRHSYNKRAQRRVNRIVKEQNFDLMLIGGDYVNYYEHLPIFMELLKEMRENNEIYNVFGNHDHLWLHEMAREMEAIGIKTLENEYEKIVMDKGEFVLIGLEDYWTGSPEYPEIKEEDQDLLRIAMIHNPDTMNILKDIKFDLALSGHYHNGQVNLIPKLTIARLLTRYVYGMFETELGKLYVTSGIGGTFLRGYLSGYIRWNARPEIVRINIRKKN